MKRVLLGILQFIAGKLFPARHLALDRPTGDTCCFERVDSSRMTALECRRSMSLTRSRR
jgi:hypothetical protein